MKRKRSASAVKVRELPVPIRLTLDALMLRSTVPTAVIYGLLWGGAAFHVAWICGVFDRWGLESPVTVLKRDVAWHLGTDIAYLSMRLAFIDNQVEREDVINHIGKLQAEYAVLTGHGFDTTQLCPVPSKK